jgi:hypothetical protein
MHAGLHLGAISHGQQILCDIDFDPIMTYQYMLDFLSICKDGHRVHKDAVTEITQPCVHTCNGLFICQLYSLPNLLEETDCKEDTPLTLPFCIIRSLLTVDNSDMN